MAKYDQGGGCACGLQAVCDCSYNTQSDGSKPNIVDQDFKGVSPMEPPGPEIQKLASEKQQKYTRIALVEYVDDSQLAQLKTEVAMISVRTVLGDRISSLEVLGLRALKQSNLLSE